VDLMPDLVAEGGDVVDSIPQSPQLRHSAASSRSRSAFTFRSPRRSTVDPREDEHAHAASPKSRRAISRKPTRSFVCTVARILATRSTSGPKTPGNDPSSVARASGVTSTVRSVHRHASLRAMPYDE
jgi:hypothetical protein